MKASKLTLLHAFQRSNQLSVLHCIYVSLCLRKISEVVLKVSNYIFPVKVPQLHPQGLLWLRK